MEQGEVATQKCTCFDDLSINLSGSDEEDGCYRQTQNFTYHPYSTNINNAPDIVATADYHIGDGTDVCICKYRDGPFAGKMGDCESEPSWNVLKALNIEQDDTCWC